MDCFFVSVVLSLSHTHGSAASGFPLFYFLVSCVNLLFQPTIERFKAHIPHLFKFWISSHRRRRWAVKNKKGFSSCSETGISIRPHCHVSLVGVLFEWEREREEVWFKELGYRVQMILSGWKKQSFSHLCITIFFFFSFSFWRGVEILYDI